VPSGSWLVFDRGYNSYKFYHECAEKGIFFVTRQMDNAVYEVIGELLPTEGETVKVNGVIRVKSKDGEVWLRRIVWFDKERNRTFTFITNNLELSAEAIAAIYKRRWQIESLFKRIKQNFPIQYFLGDSENAIKIQVWVCLIAHLLLKVIQVRAGRKWAFSNLAALIKYHLISYIKLFEFLKNPLASYHVLSTKPVQQPQLFPT
jgi:hypothetical protein